MNPAELFRQETNTVQLAPGEFLYREGDKADKMYVLLEGEIDIRVGDYIKTAREGAIIGEAAFVEDSAANAVAKSTCRLAQIDRQRFDFLVQQHPHFATHVMKSLVDHLCYVIFSKPIGRNAAWRFLIFVLHVYEVRPRKDKRGGDLVSDALPVGRLWYAERDAVANAIGIRAVLQSIR
jgi:CRP-like cAMP-binding protein